MSEAIISAIIGATGSIAGNIVTSVAGKKRTSKFEKDKNGNCILPQPFPCAWCDYELVCDHIIHLP